MFNYVILFNMSFFSFTLFSFISLLFHGLLKHLVASIDSSKIHQSTFSSTTSLEQLPKLIVFSFDGFRNDFINPKDTPNLYNFASTGVRGHMIPTMITKTYPNHQSIVTGLYQSYHGIVNNNFYDPLKNDSFKVDDPSTFWWDQFNRSVPLYIANEFYETNRISGTMQWPGALSFYTDGKGHPNVRKRVHHFQDYEQHMPWNKRIDIVIKWLTNPQHPANVVFLYFDEPDSTSHQYGPFSKEVKEQVKRIDNIVGYFREKLINAELIHKSNLIFISDHGMSEIHNSSDNIFHLIDCEKLYPGLKYEMHGVSPTWSLIPLSRPVHMFDDHPLDVVVRDSLNNCSKKLFNSKFKVFRQDDVPKEWHYSGNRRMLDLILISDDGTEVYYKPNNWRPKGFPIWGNHGYNNTLPSMKPLFIANGRSFKSSFIHPNIFENVDLYPLMLYLLQIPISAFPSNGSFERVKNMLNKRLYLSDEEYIHAHSIVDDEDTGILEKLFFVLFYLGIGFLLIIIIGLCFVFIAGYSKESSTQRRKRAERDESLLAVFFRRFNQKSNHHGSDYRMFHERPTSHLDSSFEEDDENNHQKAQRKLSQRSLTDIDWDIVGTGLDIDLASELNTTGRNIERWEENKHDNDSGGEQVVLSISTNAKRLIDDYDSDELDFETEHILSRHDLSRPAQTRHQSNTDTLIDI